MTTLRVGFCGGCLSHQQDIPLNQLFHRVLSSRLAAQSGPRLRLVISHGFQRPTVERIEYLLSSRVDLILLQVRSIPAVNSSRWIDKRIDGAQASLRLNRRFFLAKRLPFVAQLHWDYALRRSQPAAAPEDGPDEVYSPGSRATRLNVAAGLILGVARVARQEAVQDAQRAVDRLCGSGVPFIVMGSPPNWHCGPAGHRVAQDVNRDVRAAARARGFPFVDLYEGWEETLLQSDGPHLTAAGHRFVAERLYQEIGPGIVALGEAA